MFSYRGTTYCNWFCELKGENVNLKLPNSPFLRLFGKLKFEQFAQSFMQIKMCCQSFTVFDQIIMIFSITYYFVAAHSSVCVTQLLLS